MNILPISNNLQLLNNVKQRRNNESNNKNAAYLKLPDTTNQANNKYNPISYNTVFSGKPRLNKTSFWQDFLQEIKKEYADNQISDVILRSFQDKENIIGEGREKIVFTIPKVKNYVAAYLKKAPETRYNAPFKSLNFANSEYYFGQPIGCNGKFIIMKKIEGEEHSIHNWGEKYKGSQTGKQPITPDDAKAFKKKLEEIAEFPIESFIDIQKQVRYLTNNNIRIDSINPNNILIDKEAKSMHIIDVSRPSPKFAELKPEINCSQDVANLLTDSLLNAEYLSVLPENEAKKLMQLTTKIISKCRRAGKMAGLSDNEKIAEQFYEIVQKHRFEYGNTELRFYNSYKDFLKKYNEFSSM